MSNRIIPEFCQGVTEFFVIQFSPCSMQNEFTTALARDRWCSYSIRSPSSRGLCRLQVGKQSCTFLLGIATAPSVLDMVQLKFCFSCSRQRSATATGYVQEHGNNDYRVDSSIGGGSPTYDYSSSGYNSRPQQPAAQRRVNSEGELLSSYHRGDDGVMNYSMPMTGVIRYCISSFESSSLTSFLANIFTL